MLRHLMKLWKASKFLKREGEVVINAECQLAFSFILHRRRNVGLDLLIPAASLAYNHSSPTWLSILQYTALQNLQIPYD